MTDPLARARTWLEEAVAAAVPEPGGGALATASPDPSASGCSTNRSSAGKPSSSARTCPPRCPTTTTTRSANASSCSSVTITGRPSIGSTGFA